MENSAAFWLFVLNYLIISAVGLHSGLYLDNGHDQTIVQRSLSLRERQDFEMDLLDLLGLQNRPRVIRSTSIRSSGHKYLLDLYRSQLDAPTGSESNVAELDLSIIETSDAIISLKNLYYSNFNESTNYDKLKLWFDVSTIPPSVDGIIRAELRIFQSSLSTLPNGKLYTIAVQQIRESDDGEKVLKLATNVNTSAGFQGWLKFNVSGPLADWMAFEHNLGLYVEAYDPSLPDIKVDLADLGIANGAHPNTEAEDEPFMIVFMQGEHRRAPRVRRQSGHRKKKNENSETPNINPLTDPSMAHTWSQSLRSCQIQSLFVNFSDLKWQDWIIAPVGYSAFYCSGECNFPLNAHMNATNHAIVQTLVNLMNPTKVPRPCCAPTKLTPISVLYFVDDNNVILKKYKNMVVKSCGCH